MVAQNASAERAMEARIAHLESDVGHLRMDVTDIKVDSRFEHVFSSFGGAIVRVLKLYIVLSVAMFGPVARGFGWL
jgi:hypothetical protein